MAHPDTDSSVGHSFGLLEFERGEVRDLREVAGLTIEQDVVELKETAPDGTAPSSAGCPAGQGLVRPRSPCGLTADRTFDTWLPGPVPRPSLPGVPATVAVFAH